MVKSEKPLLSLACVTPGWDQPQGGGLAELGPHEALDPQKGPVTRHTRVDQRGN